MRIGFSYVGLIIFILPMLINILYALLPPANQEVNQQYDNKILEMIEQGTRILFAVLLCILVFTEKLDYTSYLLYISIIFLILYYVVWIRYFINKRNIDMLGKNFFFIPMPLAIFPVLYFFFAALWMKNYVAAVVMIVFGIAHNIISYKNLYSEK